MLKLTATNNSIPVSLTDLLSRPISGARRLIVMSSAVDKSTFECTLTVLAGTKDSYFDVHTVLKFFVMMCSLVGNQVGAFTASEISVFKQAILTALLTRPQVRA